MTARILQPILLAGGSGTRLWPLSRRDYPKQFVTLIGNTSLFQQACTRVKGAPFASPIILGSADHRFLIAEQALEAGLGSASVVLEPMSRDTAAAACMASLLTARNDPNDLVLLVPCDHVIADDELFKATITAGIEAADEGRIVVFGVEPAGPRTEYGYVEIEESEDDGDENPVAARPVRRFVEKPSRERAEKFLKAGRFLWNSGIFLFKAEVMLEAFEAHQPEILEAATDALANSTVDLDFVRLDAQHYEKAPKISLDYAIMEKAENISCLPLDTGWSDCGSWPAIREIALQDERGNATRGDVVLEDAEDCLVYSDDASVVLMGLKDVVTIATRDAVLVASRERAADLGNLVERLKAEGRQEVFAHPRVHRPWGWYEELSTDARYQVKCIMVKPGAKLSLQSHMHRAEHWVVVSGTVEVARDNEIFLLTENQSTFIPIGARHRLTNPGKIPAFLIEIQSGAYLGEDDVIRHDDAYGRSTTTA